MTAKQRVVKNPGDQHEEGIDGYGVKDFEKRKVQDESGKRREKRQKSGWDQSLTMKKSWVMTTMIHQPTRFYMIGRVLNMTDCSVFLPDNYF